MQLVVCLPLAEADITFYSQQAPSDEILGRVERVLFYGRFHRWNRYSSDNIRLIPIGSHSVTSCCAAKRLDATIESLRVVSSGVCIACVLNQCSRSSAAFDGIVCGLKEASLRLSEDTCYSDNVNSQSLQLLST
jgi:hypothetical protein